MAQQKHTEKYCKLKEATVTVLEEAQEELGRSGTMEWQIRKCLGEDGACSSLDCKYVHLGIGESGSKDPFN